MAAEAEEKLSEEEAASRQECWERTYYTADWQNGRQSDFAHKT